MKEKDLTILIPTYNQGEYLEKTIESILNQDYLPYKILISNNHSTDKKTDIILKKYNSNDLVKIFRPKNHLTMIQNWNYLVKKVETKYFSIISSDDFFEKNFIKEFMNCKSNLCGYYRFNFNIINGDGKIVNRTQMKSLPVIQKFPNNFLNQLYGPKGGFAACVYETDLVKKVNLFSESLKFYADWQMLIDLSSLTNFYFNSKIVSNYRQHYRPNLTYDRAINGGLSDHIYIFDKIKLKMINNNLIKYMYILNYSIQIHCFEYLKILVYEDFKYIQLIKNYLNKNEIKLDKYFFSIYLKKMFLRIFELGLKFKKIYVSL